MDAGKTSRAVSKPYEYAVSAGSGTLVAYGHTAYNHFRRIQNAALHRGHTCIYQKVDPSGCVTGEL